MRRLARVGGLAGAAVRYRSFLVVAAAVLLTVMTVAILGTAFGGWRFGIGHADLPTRINTVVAVCAFVLVAATLIVALMAYLAATGRPDLEASLWFRFCDENAPVLWIDAPENPEGHVRIKRYRQTECDVVLRNRSRFAARNPGIRIELEGLGGLSEQPGWATLTWPNMIGPTIFQWDGGADYIIHGKWSRTLPQLNFDGAFVYPTEAGPALIAITAADGLEPKKLRIPVTILYEDQSMAWSARRAAMLTESQTAGKQGSDAG